MGVDANEERPESHQGRRAAWVQTDEASHWPEGEEGAALVSPESEVYLARKFASPQE